MKSGRHFDQLNDLSHHAYGIVGTAETRDELISILEKTHKITAQGNPDFYIRNYETFTIDDAREVKVLHSSRPLTDEGSIQGNNGAGKKIFILTMNGVTVEAQNALLKLLEEPAEYARFFLIIPSAHLLLPTVKSRLSLIGESNSSKETDADLIKEAEAFIKANQTKRLDIVKTLVDAISKEKKTKQDAIDFLNAVQEVVYKEKGAREGKSALEAIETARNYLNDRAPSVKMLLEYVALNV
ncbi:MAG TPA: hypothetical protein VL335_03680 [Candidatus Paceibacterota bacterium]|jgi:DNA polymerase III delta prime subunit|nr:hypothetical protein [Candidatus Paceibacterota bacterium]